ncbi:MAG: hypothetical protein SNG79_01445 [Rikenellaceae bacterium]
MKRVNGTEGVALLECINPNKNRWAVRCDVISATNEQGEQEGVSYLEEIFDHEPSLDEMKAVVAEGIGLYDESSDVSSFAMGDVSMWLDKSTRTGLALTISTLLGNVETEVRANADGMTEEEILTSIASQTAQTTVRLWSYDTPPVPFDLPIEDMQSMLGVLETYAKATFDQTQLHKSEAYALTTTDEVLSYNYRVGYPDKITL